MNHNIAETLKKEWGYETYVGISFNFEQPTAIVAPGKGVIAEMKMDFMSEKENLKFSAEENYTEIYHEDGTITRLVILKAGSEKVEVGDVVLPGQILAESGGENYHQGSHVRMVNQKTVKEGTDKFKYTYFPVVFASSEGNIEIKGLSGLTGIHPKEKVLMLELSKEKNIDATGSEITSFAQQRAISCCQSKLQVSLLRFQYSAQEGVLLRLIRPT